MSHNDGMENLIAVINKVQDAFASSSMPCSIDLPQIVVVGCQSAGKSSVLENFVGRDFLPRGSGIVTRRPLVLQLIFSKEEYGEFLHTSKKYYNFNEIRNEIEAETIRSCGTDKTVSDVSINLKIFSPHVIDLTLVDLPGLTKVAVGGQSQDVVGLIRNMVIKFIEKPNSLILAVSPATTDLANSDALQIAKEVDPTGSRTIGVITKLDMMDKETNAKEILENKLFPLRRGYVGVVNRSQKEIESKTPIEISLDKERRFFLSHPAYRHMIDRMGTKYLQKTLNAQLMQHIMTVLPSLNQKISEQLTMLSSQVNEIEAKEGNLSHKSMMNAVGKFSGRIHDNIMSTNTLSLVNAQKLSTGATINRCFFKTLPVMLRKKVDESGKQLLQNIRVAIQNVHGVKTGLHTPDLAFEMIVRMDIEKSIVPIKSCLDEVFNFTGHSIEEALEQLNDYPNLQNAVQALVVNSLQFYYQETYRQLELTVAFHLNYINTNHPDFIGTPNQKNKKDEPSGSLATKKGFITLSNFLTTRNKGNLFYAALVNDNIILYKDEDEKEKKVTLSASKLRYKIPENFSSSFIITLVGHDTKGNLYKELKTLDFQLSSFDDCNDWLIALLENGVKPFDPANQNSYDLEKGVNDVKECVESYNKVYERIILDIVPKIIYYCFLNNVVNFTKNDLIAELYSQGSIDELLKQSPEEIARNKEVISLYRATKEASEYIRRIFSDISSGQIQKPAFQSKYSMPPVVSSIGQTQNLMSNRSSVNPQALSNRPGDNNGSAPALPARPRGRR